MKLTTILATAALAGASFCSPVFASEEGGSDKRVMIAPGLFSLDVEHDGKAVKLMRDQNREGQIVDFYKPTYRGKIQPMQPFAPHAVETIGELEMIEYVKQVAAGDENLLVIDSRTPAWVKRSGVIPGAVNIPFTEFKSTERTAEIMEDRFNVQVGEAWDFSYAKTLVMYCNGNWCGQSPTAIKKLLAFGYPAAKIKYYRGGMQSWAALGLTVVKD